MRLFMGDQLLEPNLVFTEDDNTGERYMRLGTLPHIDLDKYSETPSCWQPTGQPPTEWTLPSLDPT